MTIEEAIKGLKNLFSEHELDLPFTDSLEVLHKALNALEKQIPKKPHKYIAFDGIERNGCPNCFEQNGRKEILYTGQKYCSVCGCKIDRGKECDTD